MEDSLSKWLTHIHDWQVDARCPFFSMWAQLGLSLCSKTIPGEAESPFMTSPQIQGEGTRPYFSLGRMSKLDRNKNMLDMRYYYGHFWKIESTTDTLEAKGGISS